MIGKGIFEFDVEINGEKKKVGFKFGMYAAAITEKEAGCAILELFARIHGKRKYLAEDGKIIEEEIPGLSTISLLQYFYGGAVAYTKDPNLSLDEVSDMIDAIGLNEAMRVFSESISTYLPKNNKAPELMTEPGQSFGA